MRLFYHLDISNWPSDFSFSFNFLIDEVEIEVEVVIVEEGIERLFEMLESFVIFVEVMCCWRASSVPRVEEIFNIKEINFHWYF